MHAIKGTIKRKANKVNELYNYPKCYEWGYII